jgi:hypothetical protein
MWYDKIYLFEKLSLEILYKLNEFYWEHLLSLFSLEVSHRYFQW